MEDIQRRVEAAKREAFLKRVRDLSHEDPTHMIPAGELGHELGLPYEQALGIVEELQEQGLLHRLDELAPPSGPMVHITARGLDFVHHCEAA